MKTTILPLGLLLLLLAAAPAPAQRAARAPEVGFLYPAGARQGTVVRVLVGGQMLAGLRGVHVSGRGVRGKVVRYMGRFTRLNRTERKALLEQMRMVRAKRAAGETVEPFFEPIDWKKLKKQAEAARKAGKKTIKGINDDGLFKLRRHPLLSKVHELSVQDLKWVEYKYLRYNRREQLNAQISETAMVEIAVDVDAPAGDRSFRLVTNRGLTNAMCFQVSQIPEACEPDLADTRPGNSEPHSVPVVLNGQIIPGDADQFSFRAREGQKLVICAHARRLKPFLADAVPGWFQAVLTVRDDKGREIAYADDYRFDPDPVLYFEVPKSATYRVEIHDAIYRGRDDFVYRIVIGELPFVKTVFPLGGRRGADAVSLISGWNLSDMMMTLDTAPGTQRFRWTALPQGNALTNPVAFAVDDLPEVIEAGANDAADQAQAVALPAIVNGRIEAPGDRDLFRFDGRAGATVVAEVVARQLRSPLDSLVRLRDGSGKVLAWNDDAVYKLGHLHREMGVLTHHADSYVTATLPADGVYYAEVTDTQGRGGEGFAYRLRLSPPRGDFVLRVTPSTINAMPGRAVVVTAHAIRRDGFDGDIAVSLEGAPRGFKLAGAVIPAGRKSVRMTLTGPNRRLRGLHSFQMEGTARIDGREVRRRAEPCDNVMQAFLWRHLVPARDFTVAMVGRPGRESLERLGEGFVEVPLGGGATVHFWTPYIPNPEQIKLELDNPPKGIRLAKVSILHRWFEIAIEADPAALAPGFADNLIVSAFLERPVANKKGKGTKIRRYAIGTLPAVPIRVVRKQE